MADANNLQDNFLGGEWSAFSQGRMTDPRYRTALNICRNALPTQSGPWSRRVGTRQKGTTRGGAPGKVITFNFSQDAPYDMVFTDGKLRFYDKNGVVKAETGRRVTAISTASPAAATTFNAPATWADGDTVFFELASTTLAAGASGMLGVLLDREFVIAIVGGTSNKGMTLTDAVSGQPLNGASFAFDSTTQLVLSRVLELTSPYVNGDWANLDWSQDEDVVLLTHKTGKYQPYVVQGIGNCDPSKQLFAINPALFADGPYLDPYNDGSYLTVSALTGQITVTLNYPSYNSGTNYGNAEKFKPKGQVISGDNTGAGSGVGTLGFAPRYLKGGVVRSAGVDYVSISDNNVGNTPASSPSKWKALQAGAVISPDGFRSTDVGRLIRLRSEPDDWTATTYAADALVKYQDEFWVANSAAAATDIPGQSALVWSVAVNATVWTWGIITARTSATVVVVQLLGDDLLYNNHVRLWRLGAWSNTTGWPTCSCYSDERFTLGGAIKNRFDMTKASGQHFDMAPTAPDGTVADDNAISYVFDSPDQNQILWLQPEDDGILAGTAAGEWLIRASQLSDPLTPTSIQAKRGTRHGVADIKPVKTMTTLVFAQRMKKSLFEYFVSAYGGNYVGKNISQDASHLVQSGIAELVYQQEISPVVWVRCEDGSLVGTTYKRENFVPVEPPDFNGWHAHTLGSGRLVRSMASGPSPDGLTTTVTMITEDPSTGVHYIEQLTQMDDEQATIENAWYVDSGVAPKGASITSSGGQEGVALAGLWSLNGETISAFIGGVDCGDFPVQNGLIFVPFTTSFTKTAFLALDGVSDDFGPSTLRVRQAGALPEPVITMFQEPLSWINNYAYTQSSSYAVYDRDNDRVFMVLNGDSYNEGIASFQVSTGALIQFTQNQEIWGRTIPAPWSATTVYQQAPWVAALDDRIYSSVIDGNLGFDPLTDNGNQWSVVMSMPAVFDVAHSYANGAVVGYAGTSVGYRYFQSLTDTGTNYDPLVDASSEAMEHIKWEEVSRPVNNPNPTVWSAALTFRKGDYCRRENIVAIYQSLSGSNVGHDPATDGGVHWRKRSDLPLPWRRDTAYAATSRVEGSNGTWYASIAADNLNHDPTTDGAVHWSVISDGPVEGCDFNDLALGADGFIYGDSKNFVLARLDPDTLVRVAKSPTLAFNYFSCDATQSAGVNYLITANFADTHVGIVNLNSMTEHAQSQTFLVAEGQRGWVLGLPSHCECGCGGGAFILGNNYLLYADAEPVGLYRLDIADGGTMTFNTLAKTAPADIDATWTRFASVYGFVLDRTDGCPIIFAVSHGSPTHPYYVVKLDKNTGGIVWKVATDLGVWGSDGIKHTVVENGQFFMPIDYRGYLINTVNGTATLIDTGAQTFTPTGAQNYDDNFGRLITQVEFAQDTGAHTPVLSPGTPSGFHQFAALSVGVAYSTVTVPGVVGFTYASRGQLLAPVRVEDSGARNGPAFGKSQRTHMFAMRLYNGSINVRVGTNFVTMRPLKITNLRGDTIAQNTLYSDTFWDTLEDTYSFSSKLAWEITRPYPLTITATSQFLHTQDR